MQQAVLRHFPGVKAKYCFTNRSHNPQFSLQCVERFRSAISRFAELALTVEEEDWLKKTCPYLTQDYLSYLSAYRFKPEQVHVVFNASPGGDGFGNISIDVEGPWSEAIMWEVPLMACLSETYFQVVDTDWNYVGQEDHAFQKAKTILEAGCIFSEFGTRRRRSYATQDIVMQGLIRASFQFTIGGTFNGTSNVHFAQKYNLMPIGTIAHEWFMGVAALKGYENANSTALALWEDVYRSDATLIALTDTFSTECFFNVAIFSIFSLSPSLFDSHVGISSGTWSYAEVAWYPSRFRGSFPFRTTSQRFLRVTRNRSVTKNFCLLGCLECR